MWFAANAVLPDLRQQWGLTPDSLGYVTSAVQFGFVTGTLTFAFFALSDRYSPRLVYFSCALLGAGSNLATLALPESLAPLLTVRFLTGFFLAGIYPVGMKIAAGWYREDLGRAIGFLVGALVLGTSFPHLLRSLGQELHWQSVVLAVSAAASAGGLAMLLLVPDGPYLGRGGTFDPGAIRAIFRSPRFRASAFGYFGHMWELYAFWAFVPFVLTVHASLHEPLDVSFWSFFIIAAGAAGCIVGGLVSRRIGSARVAYWQLLASGVCCLLSPLLFLTPAPLFLGFLVFWGIVVVGDSPQFATLNARFAPPTLVGSALTIANCIGFAITIASIELLNILSGWLRPGLLFLPLALGPLLGLVALRPLLVKPDADKPATAR